MNKILLPAAAALVAVVGFAAPVLAAPITPLGSSEGDYSRWTVLTQLQDRGVDAVDVRDWTGETVRATVRGPNGDLAYEFFDANTLQPVQGSTGGTRVLTSLDVVAD